MADHTVSHMTHSRRDFLGLASKREQYSSVLVRPLDNDAFRRVSETVENDTRLKLHELVSAR